MNAAIRAVVRTGLHLGYDVVGIHEGYKGLLSANFQLLTARDVGGIIQQGGTILGSARCPEFKLDVQRGGAPGAFDRLLATRFGVTAIECLHHDETGVLVGLQKGQIVTTPYALVAGKTKGIDQNLVRMIGMLAA